MIFVQSQIDCLSWGHIFIKDHMKFCGFQKISWRKAQIMGKFLTVNDFCALQKISESKRQFQRDNLQLNPMSKVLRSSSLVSN